MDNYSCTFKSRVLGGIVCGFLASALALSSACLPRGTDEAGRYGPLPTFASVDRVDFAALKTAILEPYCLKCHADMSNEAGVSAYVVRGDRSASSLYTTIASGSMPVRGPKLGDSALAFVGQYIDDLARADAPPPAPVQPAASPTPEPDWTVADFPTLKARIIDKSCLACHEEMGTAEGLSAYVVAGSATGSMLFTSVESGSMPPTGPKLGEKDVALVRAYIERLGTAQAANP